MRAKEQFILSIVFTLLSLPVLLAQNLALGKETSQSTNYRSTMFQSNLAVDGNIQNFTHTASRLSTAWWRIDLVEEYTINRINIYNRQACCPTRLNGVLLLIGDIDSDDPNDYRLIATLNSDLQQDLTGLAEQGRYVMLYQPGNDVLSIGEIEIYGELYTPPNSEGNSTWMTSGSNIYYNTGNVAIGRTSTLDGYALAVDGNIRTREVRVDTDSWPDYVFKPNYDLPTLDEVQKYIEQNGHLMNIPSAKEAEVNGVKLGEMNRLLLEKLEELTLYIIQLKNENDLQQEQINQLITKK